MAVKTSRICVEHSEGIGAQDVESSLAETKVIEKPQKQILHVVSS